MSEPKRAKFVVDHFAKQVFGLSVAATKVSNSLPDDREEIAAMAVRAPELAERLTALQKKLVGLMRETGAKRKKGSLLSANGSVDDVFEHVVDVSDLWLEAVDRTVDRLNRVTSTVGPLSVTREVVKKSSVIRAANVLRPQMRFVPAVDNSAGVVFVPHLWSKPNAIVPLADMFRPSNSIAGRELETAISSALRGHLTARISTDTVVANPYETELLALEFLPHQLEAGAERLYGKLEQTPREWIDTPAALDILVGKLAQEKEIAVDLEQHFFRSYQGFVCLMQLSTRNQNFLIDTLELRSSMQKLNVIFTNPKIIKVLHGADFDIQWLQRDFGLFVVNMFDTGQAARVLEYSKKSLAFLLDKFCSVQANKQYQLADWRIRPLPKEMEMYATEDTHYLLYVYDRLRSELAAKSQPGHNLILSVLNRSRELCLQVYQKPPPVSDKSHEELFEKLRIEPFGGTSLDALKELYRWRDDLARQEDESPAFVLPNRQLLAVCISLPVTVEQLLALCVPVPPLVRAYAHEITAIVHRARSGTLKAGGARGYYAIAALLKPRTEEQHPSEQEAKPVEPVSHGPFTIPSVGAPAPELHPANRDGAAKGGLFAAAAAQGAKQRDEAVAASLEKIGKSFDPMFASRVAAAFGLNKEELEEGEVEQETPAVAATPTAAADPQSLAQVHSIPKNQKNKNRNKNKKKKAAAGKTASPLNYGKLGGGTADSPVDLDSSPHSFVFSKAVAPVPSGRNRLEEQPQSQKKSKKREDATQGFKVTSQVAPAKKAKKKEQPGGQVFYTK